MIVFKTTRAITEAEAFDFAREQRQRNIHAKKFPQEDCVWQLEVSDINPSLTQFRATVKWYQLVPYESGEGTALMKDLIFTEDFVLEDVDIQQIWELLNDSITPEDNFLQGLSDFVANGIHIWCGQIRDIFGIGMTGFERVTE